jgi:tRNA(fMet)-specific endonuclease VapC
MKVLLDTDIMSYIFAHRDDHVRKRFLTFAIGDIGISTITAAELAFGSALNRSERNRRAVERALESLAILPFDLAAARAYGQVRTALHRRGTLIGPLDMLIAAHAIALDIPLATNNVREFRRVPGLRVENWLA